MSAYQPIDCNYYDRLEAWATTRELCQIIFKDEAGNQQELSAHIEDFFIQDKVEFMKIDTGASIRLDTLISVNSIPRPI